MLSRLLRSNNGVCHSTKQRSSIGQTVSFCFGICGLSWLKRATRAPSPLVVTFSFIFTRQVETVLVCVCVYVWERWRERAIGGGCTDRKQQQQGDKWVVPQQLHPCTQSMMHDNAAARPLGRWMESHVCNGKPLSNTPAAEQHAALHF